MASADSSRMASDGLDAALAIYLGAYSFVAACFAFALYSLLQPSTSPNPGLDAYNPPPRTVISYVAPVRSRTEPDTDGRSAAAIAPEPGLSMPEQPAKDAVRTEGNEAKPELQPQAKPRRATAHPRERRPQWDYTARPYFNNYRPWF
jgi:hypothetical protein